MNMSNVIVMLSSQKRAMISRRRPVASLPDEILELIFEHVYETDSDSAIASLSLVCHRWQRIVAGDVFSRRVHLKWLASTYKWEKISLKISKNSISSSVKLKSVLDVAQDLKVCLVFSQKSKGAFLAFYSDGDSVLPLYLLGVLCQDVYGILMTGNPR